MTAPFRSLRTSISGLLLLSLTAGCGSTLGPAAEDWELPLVEEAPPVSEPPAPEPSRGDPTILPKREGLAPDHPLFAALEQYATCDLTRPWNELDDCEHYQPLRDALPSARAVGDGQAIFDVSLIRMLGSDEPNLRRAALVAMGPAMLGGLDYEWEPELAAAVLAAADRERDPHTAQLFVEVLAEINAKEAQAMGGLQQIVLGHPVLGLRTGLLKGWGFGSEDPAVVEFIKAQMGHADPAIRRAAVVAVWKRAEEDASVCSAWVQAALDSDPMVEFVALLHTVRFCKGAPVDAALDHIERRLDKDDHMVTGANTILTWAGNSSHPEAQCQRAADLLEKLDKRGTSSWVKKY